MQRKRSESSRSVQEAALEQERNELLVLLDRLLREKTERETQLKHTLVSSLAPTALTPLPTPPSIHLSPRIGTNSPVLLRFFT